MRCERAGGNLTGNKRAATRCWHVGLGRWGSHTCDIPWPFANISKAIAAGDNLMAGDVPETKRKAAPKPKGEWVCPVWSACC